MYNTFKPPPPKDTDMFNRAMVYIESYVLHITSWVAINFLKLNNLKTEFLLIGSHYGALVSCSHIHIGNEQVPHLYQLRNVTSF